MIPKWLDDELRNWARWCWSGSWPHPIPPDHAASAEGKFVGKSIYGAEIEQDERADKPLKPNAEHAEKVHEVYRNQLGRDEQRVLVHEYVHLVNKDHEDDGSRERHRRRKARKMRMSLMMYERVLLDAANRVAMALGGKGVGR